MPNLCLVPAGELTVRQQPIMARSQALQAAINELGEHFAAHKADHASRRGLLRILSQAKQIEDSPKRKGALPKEPALLESFRQQDAPMVTSAYATGIER